MKSLFPEIDKEVRSDRTAARREQVQRARDYLRWRDGGFSWIINQLLEHGPLAECELLMRASDETSVPPEAIDILRDLQALWRVGKLWRLELGIHPGSGVMSYLFGIPKVHPRVKTFVFGKAPTEPPAPGMEQGGRQ